MDISKSLKTSAIGGFKKEEVLSYIDQLVAQYEEERRNQAKELEEANSQIASLNSIVDEQYQKLMSLSAERDEFMVKAAKIDELQKLLAPYQNAQMTADEVVRQAKEKAQAAEEKLRLLLRDAQERANVIVAEANEKAKQITAAAEEEAQQRIESVKKEEFLLRQNAQHELDHAKEAAQQQLAEAAQAGRDLLAKTRETIAQKNAACDEKEAHADQMLKEAQQKSDQMLKDAKIAVKHEHERYEKGLRDLELQKSEFLRTLDEIKLVVQAIAVERTTCTDEEIAAQSRQANTETIKRRFAELNQKNRNPGQFRRS
ncbi:hypothetical protein H6A12_07125 [Phocea massiliensis]|uniref:Uncharacterized protein n=1 Tax=Merdimmobilis hominis TaxID=2897707 RepID=A0A939BE33_9FIRM|nr:hypothetical protein [Merdimmobilis hominis]MBM6920920.1 hypothetical protein [Merdimmobilis hominis]